MEKLLAMEVTIFPEKIKSSKILLKIHKTNQIVRKAFQVSKRLTNLPESKVKDFWILSLANAKSLFKSIFGHEIFICKPIFKFFCGTF